MISLYHQWIEKYVSFKNMREINVITLKKIRLHTWSEGKKDSTEDAILSWYQA